VKVSAEDFRSLLAACPLVAVLRGLTPDDVKPIGDALVDEGLRLIEVPLNSPDPYISIAQLAKRYGDRVMVGAGTVLNAAQVAKVSAAGGTLIVSPNTDVDVIRATVAAYCVSLPGYFTPTEGFSALAAGAHGLKLFPAEATAPALLKAQRAVLPADIPVLAVGGVTPENIPAWRAAGADGFGLGSNLFRPGKSAVEVARDAAAFVGAVTA